MQNNNLVATKQKIVGILQAKGPSLPVQIASQTEINSLFAGALLSELAAEKTIKISHMKVGGSPLYFIKGQEHLLEKFYQYLPSKEKEAFLLLQKKKSLEDKQQHPAIRVALRNLKDFAFPFSQDAKIFWRFHSANKPEPIARPQNAPQLNIKKQETQLDIGLEKKTLITSPKKQKEKPDFPLKIINSLQNNNIEILEEKEVKKKEFSAIVNINSALGNIKFLCVAKDKKRITENDLRLILQKAQTLKMPALVLFPQEINKKALSYAENCPLIKLRKLG